MTFEKTARLVNAIRNLETWTRSLERQHSKDGGADYEEAQRIEKWAAQSRQEIFDLASE